MSIDTLRRVAVVTDSVANLPQALARSLRVFVVPLLVVFRDGVFRDGVDLSAAQFYRRLRDGQMATTSQPSPADFLEAYDRACDDAGGKTDGVLVITMSSKLSGTFQSATQAAKQFKRAAVKVIDSLTVSLGEGWLVLEAVRLADLGVPFAQLAERVQALRERVGLWAVIDQLEFLRRTGRIGRAASIAGTLLKMKPIVTVARDGIVEAVERVRTQQRALERVVELAAASVPQGARLNVAVLHADALEAAQQLQRLVAERLTCARNVFGYMTPVIGTHAGPGAVGITCCVADEGEPSPAPAG